MAMKRKENRVPGFDEIIFENRNKEYGAYELRKRYNSTIGFSILVAVAFCVTVVTVSFRTNGAGGGPTGLANSVVAVIDDYDPSLLQVQPELKPPVELTRVIQNIAPNVVTDTAVMTSFIPIMEDLTRTVTDGDVNDTIIAVVENPVEVAPAEPEPYIFVEEQPEFPGGNQALLAYISKNLVYPSEALDNNIQGKVILKFVVKPDGSVGRIVILKGVDPLLDQEAVRVISTLPRLKPGKQNGVPVPVWFSVPVTFQLILN
jgi:periplasmic protein TonB